jgi:hypothetical protein
MPQALEAKITKKTKRTIQIEIRKEKFEAFCDAIGLYTVGWPMPHGCFDDGGLWIKDWRGGRR